MEHLKAMMLLTLGKILQLQQMINLLVTSIFHYQLGVTGKIPGIRNMVELKHPFKFDL